MAQNGYHTLLKVRLPRVKVSRQISQQCHIEEKKNILGFPKNYNNLKNPFPLKNLLCNGKVPWMLKVLYGTIYANNI